MFVLAVVGETLGQASAAVERLAGCSLAHALALPAQAELQPQGWLAQRCTRYHDAPSGTLWVGVAAGVDARGSGAALSREAAAEQEAAAARALLLAFLTSHAVLWLQQPQAQAPALLLPRATERLQQLRLLQQLKSALLPALPPLLGLAAGEANAATPGLCIPQLLLLLQPPPSDGSVWAGEPLGVQPGGAAGAAAGAVQQQQQQQAAAAAERQLRLLLKRCRVLQPEDSARALCTLPAAAPALLLLPERLGCGSQRELVAEALAGLTWPSTAADGQPLRPPVPPSKAPPSAVVAAALAAHRAAIAAMQGAGPRAGSDTASWQQAAATLAAVLEAAAQKAAPGSAASAGDDTPPPAAGVAPAEVVVPAEVAAAAAWQEACGDGVRQFSLASCKRAAAVASDAYRRNTPALLPAAGHAVALQAALRLYHSLARGPAAAAGAEALRRQLDDYWKEGHQQCEAVSFLGNPCCLPVHDPQQQPHSSAAAAAGGSTRPSLLLSSSSGAQQHTIPEPFTVQELQQAAAAVAADSAAAAARAQFHVRRLAAAAPDGAVAGRLAAAGAAGGAGVQTGAAALSAGGTAAEDEEAEEAGARRRLSGDGHSSGDEAEAGPSAAAGAGAPAGSGAAAAAAAAAAAGVPAAGCWLALHVQGPRSMYKTAALSAALLLDGQPGWLRAGGCMFSTLPLLVAVPGKPGQQPQSQQPPGHELPGSVPAEEFPSLEELKQQQQQQQRRQQQQRQQAAAKKKAAAAAATAAQGEAQGGEGARQAPEAERKQQPRLLSWPGWEPPASAGSEAQAAAGGRQQLRGSKPRAGRQQAAQQQQQQGKAAAGAAAPGTIGTETATVLLGLEYESVQGQRLLLTPALLAAALQSSLDTVSVRQHAPAGPAPAAAAPGPRTAAAAAAAARTPPAGGAALLLQQDIPLWLQLPGEQLAQMAGKRRSMPGAAAALPAGGERMAPVWLQLRRVLVGAPEVAVPLVTDPKLLVEVPREMLAEGGPAATSASGSGGTPSTVQLQYSLPAPAPIPPGSFCMLALPWLLTAPMSAATAGGGRPGQAPGPTALIRQSGPLRAVLLGGTALRPAEQQ